MRVLLTDGSGLTSRQSASLLGAAGHQVGVLTPVPLMLARTTRHVRWSHRVPVYGSDPLRWADAALSVLETGRYDVLLPTQEQVAVLSLFAEDIAARRVGTVVPPFSGLRRVQDKLTADCLLAELGIPRPSGVVVTEPAALREIGAPVFVKTPVGTAGTGVHAARDQDALHRLADRWSDDLDPSGLGGVLVQQPVSGPLTMVQAVFDRGRLVAAHGNTRDRLGPRNGATHKTSRPLGPIRPLLERLGTGLNWHGGLALDVINGPDGPVVIDVNPRLVEPGNAAAAGIDLVGALVDLARCHPPAGSPPSTPGVRTHQLLLALVGSENRRQLLAELAAAALDAGDYRRSREELTPLRRDPVAGLSLIAFVSALFIRPALRHELIGDTVANYALTPAGWKGLLEHASLQRPILAEFDEDRSD